MKFLLITFFMLYSLAIFTAYGSRTCEELAESGDTGIRKILLASLNSTLPKTPAEFEEYCSESKKIYKGLNEYKKCLKLFPKEVYSTVISSFAKVLKDNCGSEEGRAKSLKALQCASNENKIEVNKCLNGALNIITQIANSNDGRPKIIPKLCCLHVAATECVHSKLPDKCDDPTVSIKEHIKNLHKTLTESVVELACDIYKNPKVCIEKLPEDYNEYVKINNEQSILGNKEIVKVLIKLSDRISD